MMEIVFEDQSTVRIILPSAWEWRDLFKAVAQLDRERVRYPNLILDLATNDAHPRDGLLAISFDSDSMALTATYGNLFVVGDSSAEVIARLISKMSCNRSVSHYYNIQESFRHVKALDNRRKWQ